MASATVRMRPVCGSTTPAVFKMLPVGSLVIDNLLPLSVVSEYKRFDELCECDVFDVVNLKVDHFLALIIEFSSTDRIATGGN